MNDIIEAISCEKEIIQLKLLNVPKHPKMIAKIFSILKDEEISKDMEGGNTEYLKNIFGKLAKMGDYEKSINLLKAVSGNSLNQNFSSRHGIVIPNSQSLSLLTNSEQINYYSNDQYEKYCELIEAENIAFNLTTVLRDRPSVTYSQNIGKNYGFPNEEYDFNCILKLIISCYALDQDVMDDLNYLTIVPSHNHSVQSALVSLNKIPPIISYSLNEIVDRKIEKKFIFILGENSLLPGIEENFIFSYFGKNALIIKKPTIEVLRSIFSDDSFTHIYISAHGNYDHSSRDINSIEFEKDCVIPINFFEDFKVKDGSQRILILNSCSGAHTGINLNLNQKGLSANFLKNGFVVYSHLWPITSQYAAIVGCILLFKLNADDDLRKVYYETIQVLLNDNIDISRILLSLHPSFKELSMKIYDEEIHESRVIKLNNFRNTGSLCLYT